MIMKRLQEVMKSPPACPDLYLAACAIHAARGRFQAAGEKIEQALARMPSEAGRLLPRLEEIQKQSGESAPIALIYADACLRAGRHDKALAAFGEAARRDPSAFDRPFEGIEAIAKPAPKMGEAYLGRARLHAQRLRADLAVADLQQAGRLDPPPSP